MNFETFVLAAAVSDLGVTVPEEADALEFRMDLAEDPLGQLDSANPPVPVIATNRTVREGGGATEDGRLDLLERAVTQAAVGAVDVELASIQSGAAQSLLERAREHDVSIIASWHDFDGTPSRDRFRARLRVAAEAGDVGKAAVTADSVEDVLLLLAITHELTRAGFRVATMSMGAIGRHSRVIAPLYGSRIGYAPIDPADATAPGQFDLETMASLVSTLR